MRWVTKPLRRAAAIALLASCPMVVTTAGMAAADPPPNCTTADMAGIMAGVSAAMSTYLFTHPDVNAFFTGMQGKSRDQIRDEVRGYLDENPQTRAELNNIRQPSNDFRNRCGIGKRPLAFGME